MTCTFVVIIIDVEQTNRIFLTKALNMESNVYHMLEFGKLIFISIAISYTGVWGSILSKLGWLWFGPPSFSKGRASVGIYKKFYVLLRI